MRHHVKWKMENGNKNQFYNIIHATPTILHKKRRLSIRQSPYTN
ncbi:hypothetical protein SAMN05421827_10633 [Pedobacter terrae]|uniref:Uncharacterized protein n=1 Tax=Pedobacter terrae TaxID=405671 RepID=A0A1G7TTT1_9SPHI|nr:hypothetical protein SAMN05421827_10633 [Pedobacter terrae]